MKKNYEKELKDLHFRELKVRCCANCKWSSFDDVSGYICGNETISYPVLERMLTNAFTVCDKHATWDDEQK